MAPREGHAGEDFTDYTDIGSEKDTKRAKAKDFNKGSLVLELGSYTACVIPLLTFVGTFLMCLCSVLPFPRNTLNEGKFLLDNLPFVFSLICGYIVFSTVWGPRMMKHSEPVQLKSVLKYYNAFQVVICCYMMYEFCMAGWLTGYSFTCEPLMYVTEPKEVRMASAVYIYYLTKVLDLLDTVFFVLSKKWDNISVLHLVHHSTMVSNIFFVSLYMPRGHMSFSMLFNSFIHICMYGYYFLASLGPKVRPFLWWKKYLTMLQMIQLASIFLHLSQVFFNGCKVIPGMIITSMFCSIVYLLLFLDFYFSAYSKMSTKPKGKTDIKRTEELTEDSTSSSDVKQNKHAATLTLTTADLRSNVDSCWQGLKML